MDNLYRLICVAFLAIPLAATMHRSGLSSSIAGDSRVATVVEAEIQSAIEAELQPTLSAKRQPQ
jgi:hypothetical protein